jgi:chromosome segregation ATPase
VSRLKGVCIANGCQYDRLETQLRAELNCSRAETAAALADAKMLAGMLKRECEAGHACNDQLKRVTAQARATICEWEEREAAATARVEHLEAELHDQTLEAEEYEGTAARLDDELSAATARIAELKSLSHQTHGVHSSWVARGDRAETALRELRERVEMAEGLLDDANYPPSTRAHHALDVLRAALESLRGQ